MVLCKLDSCVGKSERYLPHSFRFSVSMIMKSWLVPDKQRVVSGRSGDWSDRRQWIMSPCHCLKTGQHLSLTVSPVRATASLHSPCGVFSIWNQVYTTSWLFLSNLFQENQNQSFIIIHDVSSVLRQSSSATLLLSLILISLLSSYLISWYLALGLGWMAGTMAVFDVDKCWWL